MTVVGWDALPEPVKDAYDALLQLTIEDFRTLPDSVRTAVGRFLDAVDVHVEHQSAEPAEPEEATP